MDITQEQKEELKKIGDSHNLKFIILHGSYAKGTPHKGSDLDIAILGNKRIPFDTILQIHGELSDIFGDNEERELDLKSLYRADLLLRYYVTRDGILLYGDRTEFNEFKTYARHVFEDAQRLFHLEEQILKRQNRLILQDLHA